MRRRLLLRVKVGVVVHCLATVQGVNLYTVATGTRKNRNQLMLSFGKSEKNGNKVKMRNRDIGYKNIRLLVPC